MEYVSENMETYAVMELMTYLLSVINRTTEGAFQYHTSYYRYCIYGFQ